MVLWIGSYKPGLYAEWARHGEIYPRDEKVWTERTSIPGTRHWNKALAGLVPWMPECLAGSRADLLVMLQGPSDTPSKTVNDAIKSRYC